MTTISARTILRSRNLARPQHVLSTLLLRYPRWIHAEFMTHRMLSRNAASSRAIPASKMIDSIIMDPAVPLFWGKNQKGMQADEECSERVTWSTVDGRVGNMTNEDAWREAMHQAITMAEAFDRAGYHKQIVNRLLEPFMHITVLASATEWVNFLALRDHPAAEPHIRMLAQEITKCLVRTDDIQDLKPGQWHRPFASDYESRLSVVTMLAERDHCTPEEALGPEFVELMNKLSTARCASTSYKTVEGFDMTLDNASRIHDGLCKSRPMHASPMEHVAQADEFIHGAEGPYGEWRVDHWPNRNQHGNFIGFRQYRKMLANESMPG